MKLSITGIRGIPNNYGGFEQFSTKLAVELSKLGHEVFVYNPHYHSYEKKDYQGVKVIRKRSPEGLFGSGGNYIYDFRCLKDAILKNVDLILECGYASAAPWYPILRRGTTKLVTHMDGMEWQREKWGQLTRKMIRRAEKTAIRYSDSIVCDNPVIAEYYRKNYSVAPEMISYGAEIREEWDEGLLEQQGLKAGNYYLLVARLEPENNIKMIIEGYLESGAAEKLVLVGSHSAKYGQRIFKEYCTNEKLKFLGGIFDQKILDHLRHFSKAVFHGHSAGGTNPSLLEAMAAGAMVIAHDNPYNKWVLGKNAVYFHSAGELKKMVENIDGIRVNRKPLIENNLSRIRTDFYWALIANQYEALFLRLISSSG